MKQYIKLISLIVWLLATYVTVSFCFNVQADYASDNGIKPIFNEEVIEEKKEVKTTKKIVTKKENETVKEEEIVSVNDNVNNTESKVTTSQSINYVNNSEDTTNNSSTALTFTNIAEEKSTEGTVDTTKVIEETTKAIDTTKKTEEATKKIETTTVPIVQMKDVFYFDMCSDLTESGDLDETTGILVENKRRIHTKNFIKLNKNAFDVFIQKDYVLSIFEYDSNYSYIGYKEFVENGLYERNNNVSYIKVLLRGATSDIEKSMSPGQWGSRFNSSFIAKITSGDFNKINELNKNISITKSGTYSVSNLASSLISDKDISDELWQMYISNGKYNLNVSKFDFDNRITYYVSPDGNDDNSGLSSMYPKKSLDALSGINNINIMLECGKTYYLSNGFNVGSNVTIASFGEGNRPIIKFYRKYNKPFTLIGENLYVADLLDNNIGHLMINNEVNWKRKVIGSSEDFTSDMLLTNKDNYSWVLDTKNNKFYLYTTDNPNNVSIEYAPALTGFSSTGHNIIIQGIEIEGAGNHAINFTNTSNININNCSFKYIGGAVHKNGSTRYGNAVQFWNSTNNVVVENNYARWIFDTCYTIQGNSDDMEVRNNRFSNNIGSRSQWGLELWGGPVDRFSNNEFDHNILYMMGDVTNPYTKMQVSGSGHLYGEKTNEEYISYRYGYTYHQAANLALWFPNECYLPDIHDNVFWGTNRFLVIGTWYSDNVDITTLKNNLFYEDYHLSYDTKATLYKFKHTKNMYFTEISSIVSNGTNIECANKLGSHDNAKEKELIINLLNLFIK